MKIELPKGWILCQLKDVGLIVTGNTPPKKQIEHFGGNIPWIKPGDLLDRKIQKFEATLTESGAEIARLLPPYSVMISCIGNLGKIGIIGRPATTNQQINSVIFNHSIVNPFFGFYYFLTLKEWLYENSSATTVSIINKSRFEKAPLPVPPLSEQNRIVAKLDSLFSHLDVIKAGLDKISQLMKDFRQKVLTQAVIGKLTEEWRGTDSVDRITSIIIGDEIDLAPEKWQWVKIIDVARLESGHTPRKTVPEYWNNGSVPWISLQDIRGVDGMEITETKYMPNKTGIENSSARLLPKGTVCFCRDISVGFVTIMGREMSTSQHFANWVCGERLNNKFLMYSFMASRQSLIASGTGTTVGTIYYPALKEMRLVLPPIEEQKEIVRRVESLFAKADQIEISYQKLKEKIDQLPQAILAKAFRGELVEQLPTDGDARDLLNQIRQAKISLETGWKSKN